MNFVLYNAVCNTKQYVNKKALTVEQITNFLIVQ